MTSTLAPQLRQAVEHIGTIAPERAVQVLGAEQRRLADTDDATGRIAVGDVLPVSQLVDHEGNAVQVPADGPAVLVFYRGAWCPFCNLALAAYQEQVLPVAQEVGASFVAISPQGPDGSVTIAEQNSLTYPVLTDHGGAYGRSLGLAFDLTDDVKDVQIGFGNDFTAINAGGEWSLPKPTVIVLDHDHVVRFIDVRPDYTTRTEPAAVIDALRALH